MGKIRRTGFSVVSDWTGKSEEVLGAEWTALFEKAEKEMNAREKTNSTITALLADGAIPGADVVTPMVYIRLITKDGPLVFHRELLTPGDVDAFKARVERLLDPKPRGPRKRTAVPVDGSTAPATTGDLIAQAAAGAQPTLEDEEDDDDMEDEDEEVTEAELVAKQPDPDPMLSVAAAPIADPEAAQEVAPPAAPKPRTAAEIAARATANAGKAATPVAAKAPATATALLVNDQIALAETSKAAAQAKTISGLFDTEEA